MSKLTAYVLISLSMFGLLICFPLWTNMQYLRKTFENSGGAEINCWVVRIYSCAAISLRILDLLINN